MAEENTGKEELSKELHRQYNEAISKVFLEETEPTPLKGESGTCS
jgi:hypothetical protein